MAGVARLQLLIDLRNNLRRGLDTARRQVNQAVGGMQNRLNAFSVRNSQVFESISSQVPALSGSLGALANPYMAIAAAAAAVGVAIVKCTTAANDWHEQLAAINVTAEQTPENLSKLSDKLLEIGGRNVAPLEEVPKAFNTIISAGLSVNQSLATIEPTLRAAKAGFTDIETTARAATSVMMSAGVDAAKAFDVLFATQKAGNAEFKDIANYLPKVIPLARNVGFALEETAGAYASLTGSLKPEAASTALEGMMRAMSDAKVVKNFEGLKIDIFDKSTGQARPLLDIIQDINKSMTGLTDKQKMLKFDQLGFDQSATLGFSTLIQNMPKVKSDINEVIQSQGALNKAYEDAKAPMDSWKEIQNQIKAGMIQIGEIFLPIVAAAGEKILSIIQYWKDLYNESILFRDILNVLGWLWGQLWDVLPINLIINACKLLWGLLSEIGTKIGDSIRKVTGLKGSFTDMYENVRPYLIAIKELLIEIGKLMFDITTLNINGAIERIKNFKTPDIEEIRRRSAKTLNNDSGDFSGVPTNVTPDSSVTGNNNNNNNSAIADGVKGIKGGSQTKNITINIDSFIKGFSPTHQSFNSMSMDEMEKKMIEIFMRVVRSAETM